MMFKKPNKRGLQHIFLILLAMTMLNAQCNSDEYYDESTNLCISNIFLIIL